MIISIVLLWILYPIPYMIYYKLKYGQNVEIEYSPIIGTIGIQKQAFKKFGDYCHLKKHARDKKPNLDISISNDHIYGHRFMIYSYQLAKLFAQNLHNYKTIVLDFMEIFSTDGIYFSNGNQWRKQRQFLGQILNYNLHQNSKGQMERICQTEINGLEIFQEHTNVWASIAGQLIQEIFLGERNLNYRGRPFCLELSRLIQNISRIERQIQLKALIRRKFFNKRYPNWLIDDQEMQDEKDMLQCVDFLNEVVAKKKLKRNFGQDILSSYIQEQEKDPGIKDAEITHQFLELIYAGMDTISTLTQSLCYILGKFQDVQQRVRLALINDNDHEYTQGFINETLRFYNPIEGTQVKEVINSHYLGPYWIPKGKCITVQFYANHFDKKYFPDPYRFWPERWFTEGGKDFKEAQFAFTPFWSGQRNCIGQHLALIEIRSQKGSGFQSSISLWNGRNIKCIEIHKVKQMIENHEYKIFLFNQKVGYEILKKLFQKYFQYMIIYEHKIKSIIRNQISILI
ncbi:hypothetical protein pb186bvf_010956 [Paramecium bursaria]